jgi:hypothetical protein
MTLWVNRYYALWPWEQIGPLIFRTAVRLSLSQQKDFNDDFRPLFWIDLVGQHAAGLFIAWSPRCPEKPDPSRHGNSSGRWQPQLAKFRHASKSYSGTSPFPLRPLRGRIPPQNSELSTRFFAAKHSF